MGSVAPATQPIHVRRSNDTIWNVLTFLVLISTLCVALAFIVIYINPHVSFNPFPPSVQAMKIENLAEPGVSSTPTLIAASITQEKPASTPLPPTAVPIIVDVTVPAAETQPEPVAYGLTGYEFTFSLQGTLAPVASTLMKPESGCDWLGVAGQALDMQGAPVTGLLVRLTGLLDGNPVDLVAMTGTAPQYGEGGYEVTLSGKPVDSAGMLKIQLLDNSWLPMTEGYSLDTYSDCNRNLVLVNFKQIRE